MRCNGLGLPIAAEITAGQVSDYKGYDLVMEAPGPAAKVLLADRGYDSDAIRKDVKQRGGTAMIPGRKSRKDPIQIDDFIYALRNVVERCIGKLKHSRRIATRYDKTMTSYLGFIHIAAVRLWIKYFVNRT